jgi:hypothetical protein
MSRAAAKEEANMKSGNHQPWIARHLVAATLAGLIGLAAGGRARAQTFPAAARFAPLHCQRGVMVDGYRDQSGALDERDLVGTAAAPAGLRAVDAQFLYLRMRLDASPAQGQGLRPFGWGFEISTDGDPSNYEILISADGGGDTIDLYRNTTTTLPDSPADPADQRVATYPFAQNGRVVDAGPSLFAGGDDAFLDLAVPWSALTPLGLTPGSLVTIWAGSSSAPDRLDGDLACHDAGGTTALPRLSANPPSPLAPDPARGPGPVGGNQVGASGIEGGPGCEVALGRSPGRPRWTTLCMVALTAPWLGRRRRPAKLLHQKPSRPS